ncbi:MAG: hypothetical protein EZS28_013431 [Streblomastix strix]|uniref:Uncharacterized protein n=1 Tax=Streblomastix strix TaxID=222440 RepID=A0A5J4W8T6_9EUKA|nr:MAG: hypothetical protein EZS28_013431 [Streblomastix strix]
MKATHLQQAGTIEETLLGNVVVPLTFQYTQQITQLGCIADLITGLHAELLTESGLKSLVCDFKPVTMFIKNYDIIEVTAIMAGYKATDACVNQVRKFYCQRPFVVDAQ